MEDGDPMERHLQLMQSLMQARGAGGSRDAAELAQAMSQLARGFGGSGADSGPRGRARQTMNTILTNISNTNDDSDQYSGLSELCNQLNMATEDILSAIRPDAFAGPIALCLAKEYNPELQLLAARCLTYMVDAIPMTAVALSGTNAIDLLLDRLRSVVDVELSEQCLTCVEKVASEVAGAILSKDGISAILAFVDFFGLSVQRKAWGTVATLAKKIKAEQCDMLRGVLPQMRQGITHEDAKIREAAIQALYRVVLTLRHSPAKVSEVFGECGFGVMEVIGRGNGGDACFSAALQLALAAVSYSPEVAVGLIDIGFAALLAELLCSPGGLGADATPTSRTGVAGASPLQQTSGAVDGSPTDGIHSRNATPPSLTTPLRSTASSSEVLGGSSSRKQQKALTPEMQKQVCATLAALLPRIQEGYMPFLDTITALRVSINSAGGGAGLRSVAHAPSEVNIDAMEAAAPSADEQDEEDPEERADEEVELRGELESLIQLQDWIRLDAQSDKHSRCRVGHHSCDSCGTRRLAQNNWFRCNMCPDFDICLTCMVNEGNEHHQHGDEDEDEDENEHDAGEDNGARHTFTDMSTIELVDASREAAQRVIQGAVKNIHEDPRIKMFAESTYFVQRVVEALPSVIRLRLDSEHPRVQYYAFSYVARAVHYGSPDDLRRILVDAPLCEAIVTALGDKDDTQGQVTALYIATELIQKLPDIYCSIFMREGVTNGLASMKSAALTALQVSSGGGNNKNSKPATTLPSTSDEIKALCATNEGWNRIICAQVSSVLSLFPSLNDETRSAMWTSVCTLLRERTNESCMEAFHKIRSLTAEASTFELMNCSVIHDLRAAFQDADIPVATVVDFVYCLSCCDSATPVKTAVTPDAGASSSSSDGGETDGLQQSNATVSSFTKFIRLLQSTLSNLENFKPAKFSPLVSGINSQLRLQISPHSAQQYASERSKAFQKEAAAAAAAGDSGADSAPVSPVSPSGSTPSSEGKQAQVNIEPLASLGGVIDFIRQNLLPNGRRGTTRADSSEGTGGEDDVDEVLPSEQRQGGSARPNAQQPTIYLRIGRHALPPNLSMLQVVQRYGKARSSSGQSEEDAKRQAERRQQLRDVPPQLRMLLESSDRQPIVLHYSTVPWARDVRPVDDAYDRGSLSATTHGFSPSDPIQFLPIGDSVVTEGCTNIKKSIFSKFDESHRFLSPNIEDVLSLLGVFYNAVCFWDCVSLWVRLVGRSIKGMTAPTTNLLEFVNVKLNSKAMRHSNVLLLAGQHQGTWAVNLAMDCNFLFTAETRKFLFEVSFFGTARSLVRMQEYIQENGGSFSGDIGGGSADSARRQHRLQRIKKRVWRDRVLDCAVDVFNGQRGAGNAILEFEFYNEEGSGLGPTLEFFTLTGDSLRECKYRLWRAGDEESDAKYYQASLGLFPRPLPHDHPDMEQAKRYFRVIGRFLGRALLDRRIPNLRLSRPLVKLLRGDIVSFDQLQCINERLFSLLRQLFLRYCSIVPDDVKATASEPQRATIEDMGLTFLLPGADDIELVPGGADKAVDSSNLLEYINGVSEFLLKTGIEPLVSELRGGFHELVPLHALRILSVEELQALMDGHTAPVTLDELEQNCAADHGFTMSSQPVRWLLEVVAGFEPETQRRFFQFLTGSPYLPVGGLRCLRPRLTIVRKTTTDATSSEVDQLPSAMTCQNYLKLPAYESKEMLESKLRTAVEEGCGVFLFT